MIVTVPSEATLAVDCQEVDQPMPSVLMVSRPEIDSANTRLKLKERLPGVATESSVAEARKGARGLSAVIRLLDRKAPERGAERR